MASRVREQEGETFGAYLRRLRQERRLSLGQVAALAGLGKATLSGWEAGTYAPRLPEMQRALDALAAAPDEKAKALRLLDVPRAILAERADSLAPLRLSRGDLLFGLRQRAGLTQADAARGAGVSRTLYAKWEADEAQPAASQIHAACFTLGATGDEAAILSSRSCAQTPIGQDRDDLMERFRATNTYGEGVTEASVTLLCLSFLANVGRLYRAGKADAVDLAYVVKFFGDIVWDWRGDHRKQAVHYRRARSIAMQSRAPLPLLLAAAVAAADTDNPVSATEDKPYVDATLSWLPRFPDKEGKAYLLAQLAHRMISYDPEAALRLGDASCRLTIDDPIENRCRRHDRANLLQKCGRPAEAVDALAALEPSDPFREIMRNVDMAHGLLELNARQEAARCLDTGRAIFLGLNWNCLPPEFIVAETRLESMMG